MLKFRVCLEAVYIIWTVSVFPYGAAIEDRANPFSPFDKAFYEEMKFWKCLDMYVLSYELNPSLTYEVKIGKEGVFFTPIDGCFFKEREVDEILCNSSMCAEMSSIDFLRTGPLRVKSSAGYYLGGVGGIEVEYFELTATTNLFCVLKDLSSLVAAFRVLFNPEGMRTENLKESTIKISGTINNGAKTSCLYVQGVRWVRLAIRPLIAYQVLQDVYEPATE
ncbi:MAG: hypothetical protein H6492_02685 [Candidatus Paracaedibacteraceae bacterium]|nr:hypothetical protein [Candidatus Paracaedibacteraceae bacterium]